MSRRAAIQGCGIGLLLAMAGGTGLAAAAEEPQSGHVVTEPDWATKPTAETVERFYPQRASRQNVAGRAVIRCRISSAGRVTGCIATAEHPLGFGFGEAAIDMSETFRFRPKTVDGKPVDAGVVNIPIRFELPARHDEALPTWKDFAPLLQVLIAAMGVLAACAGGIGMLRGGGPADALVEDAPRARVWPLALLGLGLGTAAAMAPAVLRLFATL